MPNNICSNTAQPESPPLKRNIPGSYVLAGIQKFYEDLSKRAGVVTPTQALEAAMTKEYQILSTAAAHIPNIRNYNKLENMLASALGWKSMLWHAPNGEFTSAGAMRQFFIEKANVAANLVQSAAVYKSLPDIQKLYTELKVAVPTMDEGKLQELLYDQIAIGQFPKLQNVYDSPVVKYQLEQRLLQHNKRLIDAGLSNEQIATLDTLAGRISGNLEVLRKIVAEQGLDIKVLQNGGYFPLQAQDDIKRFFTQETALKTVAGLSFDSAELTRRTRVSNIPIVLKLEETAKALGMSHLELAHYLSQPGELSKLLRSSFSETQLERAYTNGWLDQMPALSDELTEFINESFDLPTKNLAEAILLNPEQAIRKYSDELTEAVRNSSLFRELFTTGIDNGWVITSNHWETLANKRDFVSLGSNKMLQEFISSNSMRDELKTLFVHRTVADQMAAVLKLNSSWSDLSMAARVWQTYTGVFRKMAIIGTGGLPYLQRVFVNNAVALYASTGSLGFMHVGLADIFRISAKSSFDVLDDSKTFATVGGSQYTKRQLFNAYFLKRGSNFVSGTQDTLTSEARVLTHPVEFFRNFKPSLERYIKFSKAYHQQYSSPFTGTMLTAADLGKKVAGGLLSEPYRLLAGLNIQLDTAARWAAIQELATNGKRKWVDLDELIRHTDEYFNIQEDAGSFGKAYGSVGMPFATFALAAPGSAIRHAIRNPWQAGRMGLLYSRANIANELSDAEMSQWQKDSYAISLYTDPTTGNKYAIMPTSVDFYLNTAVQAKEFFEDVGRALGQDVGSPKEIYEQERDHSKPIMDFVSGIFSQTYGYDAFVSGVLQRDATTGEDISEDTSSLLGIPMKKSIRSALVSLFPVLRKGDELLPFSGTRKKLDVLTQMPVDPGEPSWLGYTPTDSGQKQPNLGTEQSALAWLSQNVLGLTVQEVSPVKNLISNYKDFGRVDADLAKAINESEKQILSETNEARKRLLFDDMQHMQRLRIWTDFQKWQIDQHAKEYGIPSVQLVEKLRQGIDIPRNKTLDMRLYIRYRQQQLEQEQQNGSN